jgi:aerobic carbon-monoxide dehydrogenase large subunit
MPLGQAFRQLEDDRLLRGGGGYLDDIHLPRMLEAAFLRSPHAHAEIRSIDISSALESPGVVAVYTHSDLADLDRELPPVTTDPAVLQPLTQRPLARDEVSYVGQTVAMVVAESRYQAEDAVDLLSVEYLELPAVVDLESAARPDSHPAHARLRSNVAATLRQVVGEPDAIFGRAALRFSARLVLERSAGMPMEGRGVLASFDPARGELLVFDSTQAPHAIRDGLASMLHLDAHKVRVVAPDVGGGFGAKVMIFYPEEVLVPWASLRLGRPVKWTEDRREHFIGSNHERGQVHEVEVAVADDGRILALRDSFLHDTGAFIPTLDVPLVSASQIAGPYLVPNLDVEFRSVFTNTVPVTPYRGCGRPHACFVIERVLDIAASRLRMDRAEIRRRNLIPPEAFPYVRQGVRFVDGVDVTLDGGDYGGQLAMLLESIGYGGFAQEREEARKEGRRLGLGLACYVEATGLGPYEAARVGIEPATGRVLVATGITSQGQSQRTTFSHIVADVLGVEAADVEVVNGDTGAFPHGLGTYASRAAVLGGNAVSMAAIQVRERALVLGARHLEADPKDLQLAQGRVSVVGSPARAVSLGELAALAESSPGSGGELPPDESWRLEATSFFNAPRATWGSGAQAAVVEVDVETGELRYLRYSAVHDCGTMLNPVAVEGQVIGGIAQGIGGSFYEKFDYDSSGQLRNASFMDFLIPYATEIPDVRLHHMVTPSQLNPLGAKGVGEAGAIPVAALTAAALEDALSEFHVEVREMPLSPSLVRELIKGAVGGPGNR